MGGWGTEKEVLKVFKILGPWEAFVRRFPIVLIASIAAMVVAALSDLFLRLSLSAFIFLYIWWSLGIVFDFYSEKPAPEIMAYDALSKTFAPSEKTADPPIYEDTDKKPLKSYASFFLTQTALKGYIAFIFAILYEFVGYFHIPRFIMILAASIFFGGIVWSYLDGFIGRLNSMEIDDFPTRPLMKFYKFCRDYFVESKTSFLIGMHGRHKIGLPRYLMFRHILIVGPTGERKTSSLIEPQLLMAAESPASALVPDAKHTNLFYSAAGRWIKMGKKAYLFNPWYEDTIGMNPLLNADDGELLTLIEVFLKDREEILKEDPFFRARTKYLMYAMFKMVQTWKDKYCTLPSVYYAAQSVETLESLYATAPDNVKRLFSDYKKLSSSEFANALQSIKDKLDIFMDVDVRKAFSRADFKLDMLFREGDPCLFVIGYDVQKEEQGQKIASMLTNLAVNLSFKERALQKIAKQKGRKSFSPPDLYLFLDELRKLKITRLADLLSIARESRTSVTASVTDLGFFKYYGPDFSSFMTNFRTKIVMGGEDNESAKYFSEGLRDNKKATYKYLNGALVLSQEDKPVLDSAGVQAIPGDKLLVYPPLTHIRPFIVSKVSLPEAKWVAKMQVPLPSDIKSLYAQWGLPTEPLVDPVLPKLESGFYDMAAISDPNKQVEVNPSITPEFFFKEMGGGKYIRSQGDVMGDQGNIDISGRVGSDIDPLIADY